MRSFRTSAIILTQFMLLLVAAAAFVFLLQGDLRLRDQILETQREADRLRQAQAQTELLLGAAEATRDASFAALATAENNVLLLDGQLVQSAQELNDMETRVAELEAQLSTAEADFTALQESAQNQPPVVAIVNPQEGETLQAGQSVGITVVASDSNGLEQLQILIDGDVHVSYTDIGGEMLYTRTTSWTVPGEPGEYTIAAEAINSNENSNETTITVVVAAAATATPTVAPTP